MSNIYIDCGTWTGDSILEFKKHFFNYDIYAFECHPNLKKKLENLSKVENFNFINKAVWISNCRKEFYIGSNNLTQSSSILSSKIKYIDKKHPVLVDAIDFSEWILTTFSSNDYIMLKMNMEGAEYDVLEKMLQDKSINYINKLYVAWHNKKLQNFPQERHDKLKEKLEKIVNLKVWSFEENDGRNPF